MKKSELSTLIIGSQIENKKNNEVFTINNIIEIDSKVKYHLSNDKTITASSMLRWYNLVQPETVEQVELPIVPVEPVEQVEPEQEQPTSEVEPETVKPEIVETVEPETVEPNTVEVEIVEPEPDTTVEPVAPVEQVAPVEVKPVNLVDQMIEYCNIHKDKYIVKHNSDHIAIKGINKKNLVEIHSSKRAINLVVRHQIFSEEEQMILNNCRIVGNGTFTLDLKFEITKLAEFVNTLNRASVYVPVKK